MAPATIVHSGGRRTPAGVARRRAYFRARERARHAVVTVHRDEYVAARRSALLADGDPTSKTAAYRRATARAVRQVAAAHPDTFRRFLRREMAGEGLTLEAV